MLRNVELTSEESAELMMMYLVGDYDNVLPFEEFVSFAIKNKYVDVPKSLKGVDIWETDENRNSKETY